MSRVDINASPEAPEPREAKMPLWVRLRLDFDWLDRYRAAGPVVLSTGMFGAATCALSGMASAWIGFAAGYLASATIIGLADALGPADA